MSSWKSPLEGYENAEPLPTTINPDGKSLFNPPGAKSAAYEEFPPPIDSTNNGFDFHGAFDCICAFSEAACRNLVCVGPCLIFSSSLLVYYMPTNQAELKFARELHERIRREFPEVRTLFFRSVQSAF